MIELLRPDWPAPPGVVAFSTTRRGGVSQGCYAEANLAGHVGDDAAAVQSNRNALRQQLPGRPRLAWLEQVHGIAVVAAASEGSPSADAQWTATPGLACMVLTADCLPVLLCDHRGRRVAAAHAGWRGLAQGVLEQTVAALGLPADQLLAWLGPAIGPDAFEVGPEVRQAFLQGPGDATRLREAFTPGRDGRWQADLYQLARVRLHRLGLHRIHGGGWCTATEPRTFYSWRRDGSTGRQATGIYLLPGR